MNLLSKNVFVGISLQNKTLDSEVIGKVMRLAREELQSSRVCFLVADEIDWINRRVFREGNEIQIRKKSADRALEIENYIKRQLSAFDTETISVSFARWANILTKEYWNQIMILKEQFILDNRFQADIKKVAYNYQSTREKDLDSHQKLYLCEYIIMELPALIRGIDYNGKSYKSMIYPVNTSFSLDDIVKKLESDCYKYKKIDKFTCDIHKIS